MQPLEKYIYNGIISNTLESKKKPLPVDEEENIITEDRLVGYFSCLGEAYRGIGNYQKAISYQASHSIGIYDSNYHETATESIHLKARAYNHLGLAYAESGDFDNAMTYLTKALDLEKKIYDTLEHHINLALRYNNLSAVLYEAGRVGEAESYIMKAKTNLEKTKNIYHPFAAIIYSDLALVYLKLKNHEEAKKAINQANKVISLIPSMEIHPFMGIIKNNLGFYHATIGEFEWAEKNYLESLNLWETTGNFKQKITIRKNLSELYSKKAVEYSTANYYKSSSNNYNKSLKFAKEVHKLLKPKVENYNFKNMYFENLIYIIQSEIELHNLDAANLHIKKAEDNMNKDCAIHCYNFYYASANLQFTFGEKQNHYIAAKPFYQSAIEFYHKLLTLNNFDTLRMKSIVIQKLGWCYHRLGKFKEAITFTERAFELIKDKPDCSDLLSALNTDINTYQGFLADLSGSARDINAIDVVDDNYTKFRCIVFYGTEPDEGFMQQHNYFDTYNQEEIEKVCRQFHSDKINYEKNKSSNNVISALMKKIEGYSQIIQSQFILHPKVASFIKSGFFNKLILTFEDYYDNTRCITEDEKVTLAKINDLLQQQNFNYKFVGYLELHKDYHFDAVLEISDTKIKEIQACLNNLNIHNQVMNFANKTCLVINNINAETAKAIHEIWENLNKQPRRRADGVFC